MSDEPKPPTILKRVRLQHRWWGKDWKDDSVAEVVLANDRDVLVTPFLPNGYGDVVAKFTSRHGQAKDGAVTPEYKSWQSMRLRCKSESSSNYESYGGRGIRICERWLESFENFYEDMGPRPSIAHSLDRIDVNGDYTPENCRWATRTEQNRNTRANVLVEYMGRSMCIAELANATGVPYNTMYSRIKNGWSVERAVDPAGVQSAAHVVDRNDGKSDQSESDQTAISNRRQTYRSRIEGGRPNKTFSLPAETVTDIEELSSTLGISRSAFVALAVSEFKRHRQT
jgi:hypothetical protein